MMVLILWVLDINPHKNTTIGTGVTSVDGSNTAVIGIGTMFVDNVYYVGQQSSDGSVGIITCNIDSGTDVAGLSDTGTTVGEFSWFIQTITRSGSPISIGVSGKTVDVGLSTFPTIQRRNEGLRQTGALRNTKLFNPYKYKNYYNMKHI